MGEWRSRWQPHSYTEVRLSSTAEHRDGCWAHTRPLMGGAKLRQLHPARFTVADATSRAVFSKYLTFVVTHNVLILYDEVGVSGL